MTTNTIPRCPTHRRARRYPAARAPGAKAGKHPALGNHRRPSLDWPARRPGRPMAPRHSLLGLLPTQSTGPRARAAPGHSGLRGFCCSSSSLAAPPLRQCALPLRSRARLPTTHGYNDLQRCSMRWQVAGEHAAKRCALAHASASRDASLLSCTRALTRELRLTLLRALTRLGNPAAN